MRKGTGADRDTTDGRKVKEIRMQRVVRWKDMKKGTGQTDA